MRRFAMCTALAAAIAVAVPQAQSPPKHFLWMIRHPGAPPTYLMGSLHVLAPEYYPLKAPIERAFTESKVLIEEVNFDDLTSPQMMLALAAKAMFTDGRTLDQVIAPELYAKVVARAEKAGLPPIALQRMKPWMAAVSLTAPTLTQSGFKSDLGIDKYFFDKAKKAGLELRGLETVEYQLDRFDQMPLPLQEGMLKAVLADLETQLSNVKTIADGWAGGNTAVLERLLLGAFLETPELYDRLIAERNRNWIAPIEQCVLQKQACFVVVGAAHLVGPHSVIALLQKKGYLVEQQ